MSVLDNAIKTCISNNSIWLLEEKNDDKNLEDKNNMNKNANN